MVSRLSVNARMISFVHKEMDAIHVANTAYWKQGKAVTTAARSEYQQRQDRLEEIRHELLVISLRQQSSRRETKISAQTRKDTLSVSYQPGNRALPDRMVTAPHTNHAHYK